MKIICIGRNYREHAKELNNPVPEVPVFFLKPETALLPKNHPFLYPEITNDLHFEVELVLRICKLGKYIEKKYAVNYYDSLGIGIDFTARDLQIQCKKQGLPWEIAKAFDHSAPVSNFIPIHQLNKEKGINFRLELNNQVVQIGNSSEMLFSFEEIIAYISRFITLKEGDLIFTGTPAGVGAVKIGDLLQAFIENESMLTLKVK
ncbi:MAG: fumarylacetoacetate hydrolase family protein [Bacteroidales bacterium]|nr:fumarylacetoacetate hydrolase family protein [Bacteroidales bacterium]MDD3665022.1 fumarylacetoacetate hydrolase family protein [Bacteroidales bacterium]